MQDFRGYFLGLGKGAGASIFLFFYIQAPSFPKEVDNEMSTLFSAQYTIGMVQGAADR